MFSETRYARNGDLRVAYRASREGPRDIVFVPNWFFCCEVLPELPSVQGWVEAMTSLGRLIVFDQPGSGMSDPVTPGALPTMEQWADAGQLALALAHLKLCVRDRPALEKRRKTSVARAFPAVRCFPQVDGLNRPVCGELEDQRHFDHNDPKIPTAVYEMHRDNSN
jgi:hypothetical protein